MIMWWNGPLAGGGWHPALWMLGHVIVSALVILLLIGALIAVGRSIAGGRSSFAGQRSPGLDVLEERYARGEMGREEYLQKRRDMIDGGAAV
jgi:putative membrane protein